MNSLAYIRTKSTLKAKTAILHENYLLMNNHSVSLCKKGMHLGVVKVKHILPISQNVR